MSRSLYGLPEIALRHCAAARSRPGELSFYRGGLFAPLNFGAAPGTFNVVRRASPMHVDAHVVAAVHDTGTDVSTCIAHGTTHTRHKCTRSRNISSDASTWSSAHHSYVVHPYSRAHVYISFQNKSVHSRIKREYALSVGKKMMRLKVEWRMRLNAMKVPATRDSLFIDCSRSSFAWSDVRRLAHIFLN